MKSWTGRKGDRSPPVSTAQAAKARASAQIVVKLSRLQAAGEIRRRVRACAAARAPESASVRGSRGWASPSDSRAGGNDQSASPASRKGTCAAAIALALETKVSSTPAMWMMLSLLYSKHFTSSKGRGSRTSRMGCANPSGSRCGRSVGALRRSREVRRGREPHGPPPSWTGGDALARRPDGRGPLGCGRQGPMERTVLVVGAGGLGCAVLPLLAAHGLRIRVYDADVVRLDHLQRQLRFRTADVGPPTVEPAADALARLFPGARIEAVGERLVPEDFPAVLEGVDVVLDGSDNFP